MVWIFKGDVWLFQTYFKFVVVLTNGNILLSTVDYNSWQESPDALEMMESLDKDVILAEGSATLTQHTSYFAANEAIKRLQGIHYQSNLPCSHGRLERHL